MGGVRPWEVACIALFWAALAAAQPATPARGQVVDRVVALVDGALISQLDLELEASVMLIQRGASPASTAVLDDRVLAGVLELAITQRLLTRDADKLQAFPVEEGELEARLGELEARFESQEDFQRFLARFEVTRARVGEVIRRALRAERILDNKVRLRAQVGEEEIRRAYDARAAELGAEYEAVRARLRDQLSAERYRLRVAAEVAQLRRKASVRLIRPFAAQAGEGAQ